MNRKALKGALRAQFYRKNIVCLAMAFLAALAIGDCTDSHLKWKKVRDIIGSTNQRL